MCGMAWGRIADSSLTRICRSGDAGMQPSKGTLEDRLARYRQIKRCYPISTRINRVANDDEECSAPVELAQTQNRLFS